MLSPCADQSRRTVLHLQGLRGYAALAVFLIHSGGGGLREASAFTNAMVENGKWGVITFFVLSAFTLSMSIERSKNFNFFSFVKKRFLRIFPMYAFVVIGCFILKSLPVRDVDLLDLFLHLTFLNLWNLKYQNSLIGVEWSVPIEMWTYLAIPTTFFLIRKLNSIFTVLFVAAITAFCSYGRELVCIPLGLIEPIRCFAHWSIETYFYCFATGIALFHLMNSAQINREPQAQLKGDLLIAVAFTILVAYMKVEKYWDTFTTFWSAFLIYALSYPSHFRRIIFENRLILTLGRVSFSFYLLHYPILTLLKPLSLSAAMHLTFGLTTTFFLSLVSCKLIEEPAIEFSKSL